MRMVAVCLLGSITVGLGQSPEQGTVERHGHWATLTVDSPRPLDSAAITLMKQFGIRVSAEDPVFLYDGDVKDVTPAQFTPGRRLLIPKGGRLEMEFRVGDDGSPVDIRGLLQSLVGAANAKFSFGYKLEVDLGETMEPAFYMIPAQTRDAQGHTIETAALLDRKVTIAPGTRSVAATAQLMADSLSAQTGMHVSCCQGFVAGIPWGLTDITFEARGEPARSVLKKLIAASLAGQPSNAYNWLVRCDPSSPGWCFINLMATVRPKVNVPAPLPPAPATNGPNPWFQRSGAKK